VSDRSENPLLQHSSGPFFSCRAYPRHPVPLKSYRQAGGDSTLAIVHYLPSGKPVSSSRSSPSGCGKTTLLMSIAGCWRDSGRVVVNARRSAAAPTCAAVQEYNKVIVAWAIGSWQCACFGLAARGDPVGGGESKARKLIELSPQGFESHSPWELSGACSSAWRSARALAYEAEVLLMDEPFGSSTR